MSNNTNRLLLVGLSNIGDAVMTTPVLLALQRLYPAAVIDIVADRRSSALFEHCPFLGSIHYKDKREAFRGLGALLGTLRRQEYALAVDLRTDFLPWLLRAGKRLCKWSGRAYGPHAVEKHMGVIAALHGQRALPATCVWTGPDDEAFARETLPPEGKILALGPGANWAPKIWPAENFSAVIAGLGKDFDCVVLLGDERDRAVTARLDTGTLRRIDLCGRTTLLEAAAVLKRCALFIGNDSGLGHLAAASGTPSLTLFGPGDPVRYRPWGPRAFWLAEPHKELALLSPQTVLEWYATNRERMRS